MRTNIPYLNLRPGEPEGRLRTAETIRSRTPKQASAGNRVLSMDRNRLNVQDSVDEMLSSAVVAQDKELAHILEEVDRISKQLRSPAPDTETLSNSLQRTVLCALRQSLLD